MATKRHNNHIDGVVRDNPRLLAILLRDQSLSGQGLSANISWATNDYGYPHSSPILIEQVSGVNRDIIQPRVYKHESLQTARAKDRGEVFTPAWICNAQNNLVDQHWFGYSNVFNTEITLDNGTHAWQTRQERVEFPEDKSWMKYVRCRRMEMACGEAPYLASRYDTTTGEHISIDNRIGIFDRKMRVVNENTPTQPTKFNKRHWLRKAYQALQSVYGFDWQGDNVFLSRETLLISFCEYYMARWGRMPHLSAIVKAAEIIAWNIWQMDGTRFTIPDTDNLCTIMEWHGTEPLKGKRIIFKQLIKK